jgi:hypothetical protein
LPKKYEVIILYTDFVQEGLAKKHRNEFHAGTREGRIPGEDLMIHSLNSAYKAISYHITY